MSKLCQCKTTQIADLIKVSLISGWEVFRDNGNDIGKREKQIVKKLDRFQELLQKPCTCQEKKECDPKKMSLDEVKEVLKVGQECCQHLVSIKLYKGGVPYCESCLLEREYTIEQKQCKHTGQRTRLNDHEEGCDECGDTLIILKKEEPKQECDHIVGLGYYGDGSDHRVVSLSSYLVDYKGMSTRDYSASFDEKAYCCDCGTRIDWENIKESLKQSNEKE